MQYFLYLLIIPFLYINYKILLSDVTYKVIPNKELKKLLLLVPLYYIYLFSTLFEINYLFFLLQIIITLIICFTLYYFGIWASGDAKYLLVLSLFIPNSGVIPFIINTSLITILYLFLYFIWFYFGKCIFIKGYTKNLYKHIKIDLMDKWAVYKNNKDQKTYKIVLNFLIVFLILFTSIRLIRIYALNGIHDNMDNYYYILDFIKEYSIYMLLLLALVLISFLLLFKIVIKKIKQYIHNKLKINLTKITNISLLIILTLLLLFIFYELRYNYKETSPLLIRIFTLNLGLYLTFKIIRYSYKITFQESESYFVHVDNLKKGDIINKSSIKNIYHNITQYNRKDINEKYLDLIGNLDDIHSIKHIVHDINKKCLLYEEIAKGFKPVVYIKVLKSFSFAPYLLLGFILTMFLNNKPFLFIFNLITDTLFNEILTLVILYKY